MKFSIRLEPTQTSPAPAASDRPTPHLFWLGTLVSISVLLGPLALAAKTPTRLSGNLFGEWREDCMKSLDSSGREESAPFVRYKMVVGFDGTLEQNYTYYTDAQCTKKKSSRRDWATFKTLSSKPRSAKIAVRKDLGEGMIHESILELKLSSLHQLQTKVLSTKIDLDELLETSETAENAAGPETIRKFTRHIEETKSAPKSKL
jgi:hypothetical protein